MEAKNKAIQLVEKFGDLAIDVVDEILDILSKAKDLNMLYRTELVVFYQQVKQEILNLKQ